MKMGWLLLAEIDVESEDQNEKSSQPRQQTRLFPTEAAELKARCRATMEGRALRAYRDH